MMILRRFFKRITSVSMLSLFLFSACTNEEVAHINIIPRPAQINVLPGFYKIKDSVSFNYGNSENIQYVIDGSLANNPEGYRLEIDGKGIFLRAGSEAGLFYGKQTLQQLRTSKGVPFVTIMDSPRFPYRGLHLDVSRSFYPKEFVLHLIEAMAYYKLNRLHLHLTDGGGWRIKLNKYPELTQKAAFRMTPNYMDWKAEGGKFVPEGTPGAYGGYYTRMELREIVAYAATKHVTVIPEFEIPGHSSEVFVAYPHLCCSGKPYENEDFCIGNDQTLEFVEDVLTEIMEIFPSKYIHVGGDEASKRAWETCTKCQARMKKEQLSDVDELQSYMMRYVEQFLESKGRKLIGWDEIMEGDGVSANATIMAWRSLEEGFKAARLGHDVIMTPSSYLYFDYFQADPTTQPDAIGGYIPIKRVYSLNPAPDSVGAEVKKHITGVQGNLWTEYIPESSHAEYMIFPRALALAEVAWTPQGKREWPDFKRRVNAHIPFLQKKGFNIFPLSDDVDITMRIDTTKHEIYVILDSEKYPAEIHYTTDGSIPTALSKIYKEPIVVRDSAHVVAAIFRNGQLQGKPAERKFDYHRAINKPVRYNMPLDPKYPAGGMKALVDGHRGGLTYLDNRWQGYTYDLDCVIDMGQVTDIQKVSARFMQLIAPQVFQPGQVEMLTSEDGINFASQGIIPTSISNTDKELSFEEYTFQGDWKTRYVGIKAKEANNGYMFVDEIVVW